MTTSEGSRMAGRKGIAREVCPTSLAWSTPSVQNQCSHRQTVVQGDKEEEKKKHRSRDEVTMLGGRGGREREGGSE